MNFDSEHRVLPESLTREEAEEFDWWLQDEYVRHQYCIEDAFCQATRRRLIVLILNGAIKRHSEELDGIIKTRQILKELFWL